MLCLYVVLACSSPNGEGSSEAVPSPDQTELSALAEGDTEFALGLFAQLGGEGVEENIFFSPFSISTALAMVHAGARGGTETEMSEVLRFPLPADRVPGAFEALLDRLGPGGRGSFAHGEGDPLTLTIANALWVERSYPLLDSYTGLADSCYGARASGLDFIGDPEGSGAAINGWVAERTGNRIRDLVPPGMIDEMTRLVLTNAVYFKASWLFAFDVHATAEGDFTTGSGDVVRVPMMHQTERLAHSHTGGCRAVSLPYSDGSARMLILLPDGDLEAFERSLDTALLRTVTTSLTGGEVDLAMPRFEFTSSFSLVDALRRMGMERAFDRSADFSGITGNRDLHISAVVHKAFVKVDESGTEAAAATAVMMALGCAAPEPPFEMSLDRPFLFLVTDELTGSVIFMGRVSNPSE
jgi:serpin B